MRKAELVSIAILVLFFAVAFYSYPEMPEKMASHWNAQGKADGYMPKFWGTFFMPLVSVFLLFVFLLIPRIDPLKKNIEKFRVHYDSFVVLMMVFLLYIYSLTLFWNTGERFDFTVAMVPALGVLFYYMGILMENAKMNWFIGIRTPWTLSSPKVWENTHRIGSKMFKACGIIAFVGIALQDYAFYFMVGPVLLSAVYLAAYSYFDYQKQKP